MFFSNGIDKIERKILISMVMRYMLYRTTNAEINFFMSSEYCLFHWPYNKRSERVHV
jgi:hypothetical protein